ncbi:outer membrane protein assembly factor BamA [Palleronia sp. THAF1]|uniref:outer membrane protein assembly factor BamA n=1 Tax=Palleronia sp. THAF1 TaxID=2587842 RepID=UPI000F53B1C0
MRGVSVAALAAAGVASTAPMAVAQAFSFSSIEVRGTNRVDPATVTGFLAIPRGQAVSAGELNAGYQRVVGSGLFESVEIAPQGNTLVVTVQEYPTVNRIAFEGNERLDDAELRELIGSVANRVYNPSRAEEDARAIADAYEVRGRLAASVTPRIIRRGDSSVDLVFEIAEGRVVEIERLSFVGNRDYSDRRLRRALATKQAGFLRTFIGSDTFIADRVALDRQLLTDFYRSRGYIDFRIDDVTSEFSRERNAFFVQFNVTEGNSWDFGRITASSDIPGINAADYAAVAKIDAGQTYSPRAIDNAITRMENLATERGLNFIRATPVIERDPRNLRLNVNFVIERGPRVFVERIDIEGNQTTLDRVVRRQFRVVEGDPFNPREIRAAAERIRALGYFADVQAEGREGSSPSQVVVDVNVEEQPTGSLTLGGSFSSDSGLGVNIGFQERNFLGRGQTVGVNLSGGTDTRNYSFSFTEPYLFGRDLSGTFSAFYQTSDLDEASYSTDIAGFSTAVAFPVSELGRLQLRYRLAQEEIEVNDETSPIIQLDAGEEIVSSVGATYSYDNRRSGLEPQNEIVLRFSADVAGLGGDVEYLKGTVFAGYQRAILNEEVNVRAVFEGGAVGNVFGETATRVTDRFFLSSRQLRGFEPLGVGPRDLNNNDEDDPLGGNYFAVARFEADFPLGLPEEYGIRGGAFLDVGSVWGLGYTGPAGSEVDDDFALRSSIGVSLFWDTPLGPLRFNFAEALQAEDFDETRTFNVTLSTQF